MLRTAHVVFASLLLIAASVYAQQLPEFTGEWANGGPYTVSGLKGKAVVLYFYEEG
ncbi:MAG TPA: hypothetical protein VEK08_10760 [Planctomycetota bacterium]|nr:hypothetical protein [Planctomycetota bacterium]